MSFNVEMFTDHGKTLPLAQEDEIFILQRPAISFQCTVDSAKYKANGRMYMTTQRLIFCADKRSHQNDRVFEAFEIPLTTIEKEKFNQPMFGSCNISGDSTRSDNSSIHWKLAFNNGGTGTFLALFLRLLNSKHQGMDMEYVQKQQKAYVDPNDPSVIYVSQPSKA
ncbi:hypothetical protein THRCLA_01329 [Thraustotheca clavata]|uniref:GRAM domain-containing protein n=1 Tax=Thraustotheca clavata TaxID=74557 RepID=A0A1W0A8K8_9STRA|nr:hypothetical protein THRCLA_01329 [Thraustotheca clavata]